MEGLERCGWKHALVELEVEGKGDWIRLARDMNLWCGFVNTLMIFPVE
jgi:hypothetical protein